MYKKGDRVLVDVPGAGWTRATIDEADSESVSFVCEDTGVRGAMTASGAASWIKPAKPRLVLV